MIRCEHGNFIRACTTCRIENAGRTELADRSDGERFVTRENNRVFDEIPVAQVIKERVDHMLKHPAAGNGIFAVY